MLTSIASITLIAGLALVIVGLVGGGIEVKEVKVPQLPIIPRAASILVGVVLIGLVFFDPGLFGPPAPAPSLDTKSTGRPELGTAITNHLIDVRDVKRVLQHLGMYVGPINNEPDDAYFQAVANFQHSRKYCSRWARWRRDLWKAAGSMARVFRPTAEYSYTSNRAFFYSRTSNGAFFCTSNRI
jgi:hypothetical protein